MSRVLSERGHDVTGLDSELFAESTYGPEPAAIPAVRKDIRDVVVADFDGYDAVIHLAGLSNDPLGDLNPELTYEINHRASVRIAELAKEAGVERFIFSSSCSYYGAGGDGFLTEDAPFNPVTPYGTSKVWSERDITQTGGRPFLADLHAQRDRVRRIAPLAIRFGVEQPRGMGGHPRHRLHEKRRDGVASDRPHRRHLAGDGGGARSAARFDPQRSFQRGPHRGQLPGSRSRRDRAGYGSRLAGGVRRRQ